MLTRFAAFALVAALSAVLAPGLPPRPASAQIAAAPGVTLPDATGTLARGGRFTGTVTVTRLTARAGQLVADGAVSGTTYPISAAASPADDGSAASGGSSGTGPSTVVTQSFREIPLTLIDPDGGPCDALTVDLSAVFLDQTGVQLDLAPTTLDLVTLPRASRPLGNLLCAVSSLVEASPGGSQAALLNELLPVVNHALAGGQR